MTVTWFVYESLYIPIRRYVTGLWESLGLAVCVCVVQMENREALKEGRIWLCLGSFLTVFLSLLAGG